MAPSSSTPRDAGRAIPRFDQIETDRLLIRRARLDDVDTLHERRNDPTTAAFQAWAVPYPRERSQELIDSVVAADGVPPGDGWFQVVIDERSTGDTIGDLALHLTFGGRCAEIGYTFAASARDKGYATEAAAALSTWCIDVVGVSRVSAQMHPDNVASMRVAERIGMEYEGRTRNSFWLDRPDGTSENSDDVIYAMTPATWERWRDRNRSRPDDVRLVEVTHENLDAVYGLETHRTQRKMVATTAFSIGDAFAPEPHEGEPIVAWPRAVEADGELVGFVMLARPNAAAPEAYLWRLLIDRMHQRRGIGRRVVDLVIEQARAWGCPAIDVSWVPGPGSPEPLYLAAGFVPTGEIDDGEVVARRAL